MFIKETKDVHESSMPTYCETCYGRLLQIASIIIWHKTKLQQECILVGYIPSAAVAATRCHYWDGHPLPPRHADPPGCRSPPMQTPPLWIETPSHVTCGACWEANQPSPTAFVNRMTDRRFLKHYFPLRSVNNLGKLVADGLICFISPASVKCQITRTESMTDGGHKDYTYMWNDCLSKLSSGGRTDPAHHPTIFACPESCQLHGRC